MNHKVDWIRALELAEKGVERVEQRRGPQQPKIISGGGNPSDYSQQCNNCGKICGCYLVEECSVSTDCQDVYTCSGLSCCPDPLPNSHQVANYCTDVLPGYACSCRRGVCSGACSCNGYGTCTYDCDPPHVWDPILEECVLPAKQPVGDGLTFAI